VFRGIFISPDMVIHNIGPTSASILMVSTTPSPVVSHPTESTFPSPEVSSITAECCLSLDTVNVLVGASGSFYDTGTEGETLGGRAKAHMRVKGCLTHPRYPYF